MPTNSETISQRIVQREGMPVAQDVGDGAGLTGIAGQTRAWLDQWNLPAPASEAEAATNIQVWFALSGLAQVVNASLPLGDVVCDWAYNSGVTPAVRGLQTALGVTADGKLGSQTLAALAKVDCEFIASEVARERIKFLAAAFTHGQIDVKFCAGLMARAMSFV